MLSCFLSNSRCSYSISNSWVFYLWNGLNDLDMHTFSCSLIPALLPDRKSKEWKGPSPYLQSFTVWALGILGHILFVFVFACTLYMNRDDRSQLTSIRCKTASVYLLGCLRIHFAQCMCICEIKLLIVRDVLQSVVWTSCLCLHWRQLYTTAQKCICSSCAKS